MNDKRVWKDRLQLLAIFVLLLVTVLTDFVKIAYVEDEFQNRMISKIVQQGCGAIAGVLLLLRLKIRLFGKVENWLYMIPCLLIAIDNFQWSSFLTGKMQLVHSGTGDFALFFLYCLSVGLFEEIIFRGLLFSIIAGYFPNSKKGLLQTYVVSSLIFGLAHLLNGFSFGTLLQVSYTVLTGGLFAFCLMKTKNILCPALVHGVYNFCGLLFDKNGLGTGIVFDLGTVLTMLVVSVAIGAFVLYKTWTYSDEERNALYAKLSVHTSSKK